MPTIEPEDQNIELIQQPLVTSNVTIILDDENISASCAPESVQEVIKGSAGIRFAFSVDSACQVPEIEGVVVSNNLFGEGETPTPNLQPVAPSFLPSLEDLVLVKLSTSQSTVDSRLYKRTVRSAINVLTNNYKSGSRVRSGIITRNR
jgi:hypothetical protein